MPTKQQFPVLVVILSFVMLSGTAFADPNITSVLPTEGVITGGDTVWILGTGFSTTGTTRVTFGGTDATGVTLTVDPQYGTITITCVTPAHAAGLVDVTVINSDGLSGTAFGAFTFYTPPPAPVILTNGGNNFLTNTSPIQLSGSCSASTFYIYVNGTSSYVNYTAGNTTWSYSRPVTTQGNYTCDVVAIDSAGHWSPKDSITVTFDNVAPVTPVINVPTSATSYLTNNPALSLGGACASDSVTVEVNSSTNGVTYTAGAITWSFATTLSSQGNNTFSVRSRDLATNLSAADTIVVIFDSIAPTVAITTNSGNDYATKSSSLTLNGTCSSDASSIQVNGSTTGVTRLTTTTWSYAKTLTVQGPNLFTVRAYDTATNYSTDTITVTYDTIKPDAPVITAPTSSTSYLTNSSALTLSGTCAADTNAIYVGGSTTGVSYTPGATTWSYSKTLTTQGASTYIVVALDLATNVSDQDSIVVTYDSVAPTAPVITTNGGVDFLTNASALTLNGTCAADSNVILVNGSVTGVTYTPGSTSWSYDTTLSMQGDNPFTVTAVDLATNESSANAIIVQFDNIPPAAPVITAPNGGADFLTNAAALTISGTCGPGTNEILVNDSSDGVTFAPGDGTWSYDTTLSVQGPNLFSVTAVDLATNASAPDAITVSFDDISPTVTSTLDSSSPTNLSVLRFNEHFSEFVGTTFTVSDVTVVGSLAALAGAPVLTGTDPDYSLEVTLSDPDAEGTLGIMIGTDVADLAGNPFEGNSSPVYVVDNTPPTVNVTLDDGTPTNKNVVHFTEHFNEYVGTSFTVSDVKVIGTLTGTPVVTGTDPDYEVAVTLDDPAADGTIGITVGDTVTDLAGNFFTGNTSSLYTVDNTPPTADITLEDPTPTNQDVIHFRGLFNENVGTSFTADDVTVIGTVAATATVTGTDPDYTVSVTLDDPDADGMVGIYIGKSVTDLAENAYEGNSSSLCTVDNTPPVVTVHTAVTNNLLPLVTGTVTDANGVAGVQVTINGKTYPAQLSGGAEWSVQIPPGDELTGLPPTTYDVTAVATDTAGNTGTDPTSGELRVDTAAATIIEGMLLGDATPTGADSVTFHVTFSLPVTPVAADDFTIDASAGITGASVTSAVQDTVDPKIWIVTVNTGAGSGTLGIDVTDLDATMRDTYGRPPTLPYTTGPVYSVDKDHPTPVITGSSALTNATRTLTITFGENVNGFTLPSGVSVTNGVASNLHATATPGVYTVDVRGSGTATVSVSVPAGVATDDASNSNNATATPFTFPFDGVSPTATITLTDPSITGQDAVHFGVHFSESVGMSFADMADVSITGTLAGTAVITGAGADFVVTVTLADPDLNGEVGISIGTTVTDLAGNPYLGGTSAKYTIDNTPPMPVAGLAGMGAMLALVAAAGARKMRRK